MAGPSMQVVGLDVLALDIEEQRIVVFALVVRFDDLVRLLMLVIFSGNNYGLNGVQSHLEMVGYLAILFHIFHCFGRFMHM